MLYEDLDQFSYVAIRFGEDAFYARGADAVAGFEYPESAMLFSDMHKRDVSSDALGPASFDDFDDLTFDAGTYIEFETDAFEGICVLALPAWCASADNLMGAANSLTYGWGVIDPKIVVSDVTEQ